MSNTSPPRPAVDAEQLRPAVEQLHRTLRAYVEAIRPALERAATQLAALAAAVRDARADDYALAPPPAAPRDRPAWQSPHSPACPVRRK